MRRVASMSKADEPLFDNGPKEASTSPLLQTVSIESLTADPVFSVLFTGMKTFWQSYFVCHAALLRHVEHLHPDMDTDARAQLVSKCAQAAVQAAQSQPPTAKKLYANFKDICGPILRELGTAEDEIEKLDL